MILLWGEMFLITKNDCGDFGKGVFFDNQEWFMKILEKVVPGIESWRCCRQLCSDSDNCNFWVGFSIFFFYESSCTYTLIWEILDWKRHQWTNIIFLPRVISIFSPNSIYTQVWAHQGAGLYAGNCALMSGYGNTADDTNVISGPKICF